ncbi:hypothetical protein B0T10DRAFT_450429 [Thelonectria olida]|uniref:Uncharacterized protein n=1 Tax=Thelonectria olida TaxID=1576542 RepID=A0A9P9AHI9_9HYPO|nr:hypothetical protein B0T10DRAFT_450429 [Thelonectria olida]
MDPLSILNLFSIGVAVTRLIGNTSTGPLDEEKWKKCVRLGPSSHRFHGVWDIALKNDQAWRQLGEIILENNARHPSHRIPQDENSVRLSVGEQVTNDSVAGSDAVSGFTALSSQWREADSHLLCPITTYETSVPERVVRYLRVFEDENQRRQVHILCRTYGFPPAETHEEDQAGGPRFYSTERLVSELQALDSAYRAVRTRENWKQTFLLQVHHACLRFFAEFLESLVLRDGTGEDADMDPAWAELRLWNLRKITKHAYECRRLSEMGRKLVTTTESLIDVVRASLPISDSQPLSSEFMAIGVELQGCCREVKEQLQKLSDGLEHDLKFLELSRNVNQTRGVQQLTLLATVFLPLSLAAGVLSMQTRFKDLGTLLYDFFGVVVLLGAIVLIIIIGMTAIAILRDQESRILENKFYRESIRGKLIFLLTLGLLCYGSLILSSFLVGLFRDVSLGAKILGYGSAAAFGLVLMSISSLSFLIFIIAHC